MYKIHRKITALFVAMAFMTCTFTSLFGNFLPKTKIYAETSESENTVNYGDLNKDNVITVRDTAVAKRMLLQQSVNADFSYPEEADVNGNDIFNVVDVENINSYVLGESNIFAADIKRNIESVSRNSNFTTSVNSTETFITEEMYSVFNNIVVKCKSVDEAIIAFNNYIKTEIELEFYYGLRKGAIGAFEQKSGNDVDIACISIALMALLGVEANYAIEQITLTKAELIEFTNASNINQSLTLLNSQGRKVAENSDGTYSMYWVCVDIFAEELPYEHTNIAVTDDILSFINSDTVTGLKCDTVVITFDGMSFTLYAFELYGENINISFEDCSEDLYMTAKECESLGVEYLEPVLTIFGQQKRSDNYYLSNKNINLDIEYTTNSMSTPVKLPTRTLTTGNIYSIVFDINKIGISYLADLTNRMNANGTLLNQNNLFSSNVTNDYLSLIGCSYFAQLDNYSDMLAEQEKVMMYRSFGIGIVGIEKNPAKTGYAAMTIDIPQNALTAIDEDGNSNSDKTRNFQTAYSILSSYMEGTVIEQFSAYEGVSAAKVIEEASNGNTVILSKYNFDDEIESVSVYGDSADDLKAKNQLRSEVFDKNAVITIAKNRVTINEWTGNGAIIYYPDTGLYTDTLYYTDKLTGGGSSSASLNFAYFVDMAITSCDIAITIATMLAIAAGSIASPIMASLVLTVMFFSLCSSMEYYIEEMDLYIDASNGDEEAEKKLKDNSRNNAFLTITFGTAGKFTKPIAGIALKAPLAKKMTEKTAEKLIQSGADISKAIAKFDSLLAKSLGEEYVEKAAKSFNNFSSISDDVYLQVKSSNLDLDNFNKQRLDAPDTVPKENIEKIKAIRDTCPTPTSDTIMTKVISDWSYSEYFTKEYNTVRGFTTEKIYVENFTTPKEFKEGLALNYPGSTYSDDAIYVIEYTTEQVDKLKIPYSTEYGGSAVYGSGDYQPPFTGNGFTASKDNLIPEYQIDGTNDAIIQSGEIYRVHSNGYSELVAIYDPAYDNMNGSKGVFKKIGDTK
jgi:hypothetical protein